MERLSEQSKQIVYLLEMKEGRKYKYSAYALYTHMGYPRGTVTSLSLKVRNPKAYKKRVKLINSYKKKNDTRKTKN